MYELNKRKEEKGPTPYFFIYIYYKSVYDFSIKHRFGNLLNLYQMLKREALLEELM